MDAHAINQAIDDAEQSVLRKMAKAATRAGGPAHYFSETDTFDRIPGGMLCRRNNHVKPVVSLPVGDEYGVTA